MLVYAMNRHHPNPKVGHYTQQAATRFYAVTGSMTMIASASNNRQTASAAPYIRRLLSERCAATTA